MSPKERSVSERFARDEAYLLTTQYATTTNLEARVALHTKYTTATQGWYEWMTDQIDWHDLKDILEVGCGTGLFWSFVSPSHTRDRTFTLSDLSEAMVDAARARAASHGHEIRTLTADVHHLPFRDESFDVVIANHMLYHSPEPLKAIAEIARVLRPGGTLFAATNGPNHLLELHDIDAVVFGHSKQFKDNAKVFGSITGVPLLAERFLEVEWRPHEDRLLCTNPDDVVAYITSMAPGEKATPSELAMLRSEVRRRINLGGGALHVSKDSGLFTARSPKAGSGSER